MMQIIPLSAVPSQNLRIVLGAQQCQVNVYVDGDDGHLFLDLSANQRTILTTVICRDRVRIIREKYLGFSGDLTFMDTEGAFDPTYDGLGKRFQLVYLEPADL